MNKSRTVLQFGFMLTQIISIYSDLWKTTDFATLLFWSTVTLPRSLSWYQFGVTHNVILKYFTTKTARTPERGVTYHSSNESVLTTQDLLSQKLISRKGDIFWTSHCWDSSPPQLLLRKHNWSKMFIKQPKQF